MKSCTTNLAFMAVPFGLSTHLVLITRLPIASSGFAGLVTPRRASCWAPTSFPPLLSAEESYTSCSCGSAVGSSLCEAVTSDTALALLARSPACSSSVGGILPVFFLLVSPVPAPTFLVHCCHLRFLPDPLLSNLSLSLLRPWVTGSLASSLLCFGLLLLQHWGSRRQRTLPILSHLARRALQATLW